MLRRKKKQAPKTDLTSEFNALMHEGMKNEIELNVYCLHIHTVLNPTY